MAPIALLLSLSFSVFLLAVDLRRHRSVSGAVWLPTLLLLILGSRPVSMWLGGNWTVRENQLANDVEGSVSDQVFYLIVLIGSLIVVASRRIQWSKFWKENTALSLFYLFFAISVVWSGDPSGSLKRWIKDFGTILVVGVILTEKKPLEAISAVYFRCACVLLPLSIVFIRYYPAWGRGYARDGTMMYTGVTTQKNTLGEFVCVVGLVLLWNCLGRPRLGTKRESLWKRWDHVLLLAMGLWLLNASQSKTALLCLVIGGTLLISPRWLASRTARASVFAVALSVPFFVLFSQQFSSVLAPVLEALGRNATFTGRTDIWQHITLKTVNPLIGEGFWNFWGGPGGVAVSHAMHVVAVPNAHCGYMDIYLDGGAIGVTLLLGLLIACSQRFTKLAPTDNFQVLRFAFLVAMILYNNSESTFARPSSSWFTMLLLTVELSVRRSRTRSVSSDLAAQKEPQRAVSIIEWEISK